MFLKSSASPPDLDLKLFTHDDLNLTLNFPRFHIWVQSKPLNRIFWWGPIPRKQNSLLILNPNYFLQLCHWIHGQWDKQWYSTKVKSSRHVPVLFRWDCLSWYTNIWHIETFPNQVSFRFLGLYFSMAKLFLMDLWKLQSPNIEDFKLVKGLTGFQPCGTYIFSYLKEVTSRRDGQHIR